MFSRVLVGLDGSERAAHALAMAATIARASNGSLILAQVLNAPAEFLPYIAAGLGHRRWAPIWTARRPT